MIHLYVKHHLFLLRIFQGHQQLRVPRASSLRLHSSGANAIILSSQAVNSEATPWRFVRRRPPTALALTATARNSASRRFMAAARAVARAVLLLRQAWYIELPHSAAAVK